MQSKKTRKQQEKRHFSHLWPLLGCCSYHTLIVRIPRLLCMMNQCVGMLQYQMILRRTQSVGCRAKNRQTARKKRHFGNLLPFWECCIYHTVIVRTPRLLSMMVQYVGMLQYQNIFRQTQFVGCRAKNRQPRRKKASVYDKLVCWHAPVSKILRWTQFVGFRAKTGKQQEKRHFGYLWPFWGS